MAAKPKPKAPPALEVYDCDQRSDAWRIARLGRVTCSVLKTVMASGKDGDDSTGRTTLMRKLAGEILTGIPMESYTSKEMELGKEHEPEIRDWYARTQFAEVREVGFVWNPEVQAGCSPDGLIDDDGMIEIKWATPHVMIGILEKGVLPTGHRAQCHGGLWVCRRKWIDLVIYSHPKIPKFKVRIERDPVYEQQIAQAVATFNYELKCLVAKYRGERVPAAAELEIPL